MEIGICSGGVGSWNIGVGVVEVVSLGEERRGEGEEGEVCFSCIESYSRSLFGFENNCYDDTRYEIENENKQTIKQEVKIQESVRREI